MPLPVRRVLVGLLLALLPALAASAARPAASTAPAADAVLSVATASTAAASDWRQTAPAAQPAFSSGVYAVTQYITGGAYPGTWTLTVTGGVVSGISEWACCPGSRTDPMTGTAQGFGVVIVRDCTGQGLVGPCSQTFVGTVDAASGDVRGTWSGSYDEKGGTTWEGSCISGECMKRPPPTETPPTATPPADPCSQPRTLIRSGVAPAAAHARDCSPPKVRAFRYPGFVKPGTRITLGFSVKDDSGHAKAAVTLYEGGQRIWKTGYNGKATGRKLPARRVPLAADLKGPMFFCVWAMDAAGNKSLNRPRSSCAWIKMVVPIERVSNGCGGEGWDEVVAAENYFGNTGTYYEPDGTAYEVDFTAACNLHDAGYGGQTVVDEINGPPIDFHDWSRGEVDEKFRMDMRKLCDAKIPASASAARWQCWHNFRYVTVRTVGNLFFDADPMWPGTQSTGTRSND